MSYMDGMGWERFGWEDHPREFIATSARRLVTPKGRFKMAETFKLRIKLPRSSKDETVIRG